MSKYIVLIGDVIKSRTIEIKERNEFQQSLEKDLNRFNKKYKDKIVSDFTVTLGDEFQGFLYDAKVAFEVITYLQVKYSYQLRYGIGIGELYTGIKDKSIGMDGPSWWNSRKALEAIKQNKDEITNICVSGITNVLLEELINNAFIFVHAITKKWNTNQKKILEKIIRTYGLNNEFKQVEFAKKFKIDPSKVSRTLKSTMFLHYVDMIKSIAKIINKEVGFYG
ncbi:MAG TPA: hypothetical protein GX708_05045 [Gallicola sp.]|jgi:hypothetical protein|nr:hypothetical protein [Gallicola sp.]